MQTAQRNTIASTQDLASPAVQPSDIAGQIMEASSTPEQKKAAFITLFYGTDDMRTKAVDYFYENPILFSQTVKDLSGSVTHKDALKSFLQKMADPVSRIKPFMTAHFEDALKAKTWTEYQAALRPYFALKDTFEGVDKNRRSAHSCPSAFDLLRTFNTVNKETTNTYVPKMYKIVGSLNMDK